MSTDILICPDCGGIIGGDENSDHGRPCTCFSKDSAGDTSVIGKQVPQPKVCWKCGKDLTGRKRARDSMGYWCYECHMADKEKNKPQGVRCAECGRKVLESALYDHEGLKICTKCRDDHAEVAKQKRKYRAKVGDNAFRSEDKKRLYIMLGVMGALILLILLHHFNIIGGMLQ